MQSYMETSHIHQITVGVKVLTPLLLDAFIISVATTAAYQKTKENMWCSITIIMTTLGRCTTYTCTKQSLCKSKMNNFEADYERKQDKTKQKQNQTKDKIKQNKRKQNKTK